MLAGVRMAAFLVIAPPFAHRAIPGAVKVVLAIGLALAVGPRLDAGCPRTPPPAVPRRARAAGGHRRRRSGFLVALVFDAIQSAGALIDLFGGFQMAQAFDPMSMTNGAQFARLYQMTALVLLFASDAYQLVLGRAGPHVRRPAAGRRDGHVGPRRHARRGHHLDVRRSAADRRPADRRAVPRRRRPGPAHPGRPCAQRVRDGLPAEDLADPHVSARSPSSRCRTSSETMTGRSVGAMLGVLPMSDGQERTEKATPQRMKEVRRKGGLSTSQDLVRVGRARRGRARASRASSHAGRPPRPTSSRTCATSRSTRTSLSRDHGARRRAALGRADPGPMLVARGARGDRRAPRRRAASTCDQGSSRTFEQLNPTSRAPSACSARSPVAGRQDAAEDRVSSRSCCSRSCRASSRCSLGPGGFPCSSWSTPRRAAPRACCASRIVAGVAAGRRRLVVVMRRNRKQTRMTQARGQGGAQADRGRPAWSRARSGPRSWP